MTSEVLKFTNNDTARIRSQQKEIKLDLELDSCEPKFDLSRFVCRTKD